MKESAIKRYQDPKEREKSRLAHNYSIHHSGSLATNWKGGKVKSNNYWLIYQSNHPNAVNKYIKRANLVAEQYLNRYLNKEEIVHHINNIKDDDRPKNLYVFDNKRKHTSYHKSKNTKDLKIISNIV